MCLDYADNVFSIIVAGETVFKEIVIVDARPTAAGTHNILKLFIILKCS